MKVSGVVNTALLVPLVKRLRESKDHVECQIAEEIEAIMETAGPAIEVVNDFSADQGAQIPMSKEIVIRPTHCAACGENLGANGHPDVFKMLHFQPNFKRAMEKATLEVCEPWPMCDECYHKGIWFAGTPEPPVETNPDVVLYKRADRPAPALSLERRVESLEAQLHDLREAKR